MRCGTCGAVRRGLAGRGAAGHGGQGGGMLTVALLDRRMRRCHLVKRFLQSPPARQRGARSLDAATRDCSSDTGDGGNACVRRSRPRRTRKTSFGCASRDTPGGPEVTGAQFRAGVSPCGGLPPACCLLLPCLGLRQPSPKRASLQAASRQTRPRGRPVWLAFMRNAAYFAALAGGHY